MVHSLRTPLGAITCALFLASCDSALTPEEQFAEGVEDFNGDFDEFETLTPTPFSELPTGTVNYDGVFGSSSDAEMSAEEDFLAIVGDMTVAVDFAGNAITGTASDLVRGDGTRLNGTIGLTGGNIAGNAAGSVMTGALNGDLTFGEDGFYIFNEIQVTGDFAGDQGEVLAASGSGNFTLEGNNGDTIIPFFMGFIVEADD